MGTNPNSGDSASLFQHSPQKPSLQQAWIKVTNWKAGYEQGSAEMTIKSVARVSPPGQRTHFQADTTED